MLDIFERKNSSVQCEFVHPQTLDEKSMELFENKLEELPAETYRILLNNDKVTEKEYSHFLQKHVKIQRSIMVKLKASIRIFQIEAFSLLLL